MCNWRNQRGTAAFILWAATSHGAYACEQRIVTPFTLTQSNGPWFALYSILRQVLRLGDSPSCTSNAKGFSET